MSGIVFGVIFSMIVCGLLGLAVGDTKGRGSLGFWLGLFLSVLGVAIVALTSPTAESQAKHDQDVADAARALDDAASLRPCPWCAEKIQPAAKLCRYCGRDVVREEMGDS